MDRAPIICPDFESGVAPIRQQRDADHDFYTLPKEETIEKIVNKMMVCKHIQHPTTNIKKYIKEDFTNFATELYNSEIMGFPNPFDVPDEDILVAEANLVAKGLA